MNNNIDLKKTEKMEYINFWCQKVIPLVFDDSLSYYEAICKFMQKLNEVINALNNNAECIDELQGKYIILQNNFDALEVKWEEFKTYIENKFNTFKTEITTKEENFETTINNEFTTFKNYVENYLNNIDVQSYVNIKIDQLAESGYFTTLLTNLGFNPDNYLAKNNTTLYVPTDDYNPATKKYVDEHSSQGTVYSAGNGIKIENNTISTTNYNATNNYSGIKTDMIQVGNTTNTGEGNNNNSIGVDNTFSVGNSNIALGIGNNIMGIRNIMLGISNTITSNENETICIGKHLKPKIRQIIIGKYNLLEGLNDAIIIGNGGSDSSRHNAIVIPQGTTNPININQEVNCSNNFITRTFVEGDNVDTIYAEKPNALVNASEVKASIKSINDRLDNVIDTYTEYNLTLLNNFTGSAKLINKNGILYLDINVIYPTNTTSDKEQDIDIFKITQITASNYNGFKNDVGILVNKTDTSSREETRCIRTTIINDNQISVSYIAKDLTQTAPKGYTFTYFGVIGVEKHS